MILGSVKHRLELYIGCMKAGKSSEAIRIAKRYKQFCNVLYVTPKLDIKTSDGIVTSRSGIFCDCIAIEHLHQLEQNIMFKQADVIICDEAQFFPDLYDHVVKWCNKKTYIISSLDGDKFQKKFGQVWDLIPLADKVEKLTALCELCKDGTPGICTILKNNDHLFHQEQIDVEHKDGDTYISVCRQHCFNPTLTSNEDDPNGIIGDSIHDPLITKEQLDRELEEYAIQRDKLFANGCDKL